MESGNASPDFSTATPGKVVPLSEGQAAALDAIADDARAEDAAAGAEIGTLEGGELNADALGAMMEMVVIAEDDVKALLSEAFDLVAMVRDLPTWKLSERQAGAMASPYARLLNSLWQRYKSNLPVAFDSWCSQTPGAAASVLMTVAIVAPKVLVDVRATKLRAQKLREAPPEKKQPAKDGRRVEQEKPDNPFAAVDDGPGGIEVARGIVSGGAA